MPRSILVALLLACYLLSSQFCIENKVQAEASATAARESDTASRPNILLIMADDLGFSDLGCYGSEIATPNLDALSENGIRYSQFYNTARCWPTRASLLTGYYAQQVRRDTLPNVPSGGGNRGKRQPWAVLLPKMLHTTGYRSYHTGKWHIDGMPIENGFDRSYLLKDQGRFFNPIRHWRDDVQLPPVKKGTGFYAPTALAAHAIEVLQEHAMPTNNVTSRSPGRPTNGKSFVSEDRDHMVI